MSEEFIGPRQGNFYTASRNVQELVGKLPDGTYIWGGPYTVPQVLCGVVVFVITLGARQIGLWGGAGAGALIFDLLVIAALSVGTIFLIGKLPAPKRSIFGLINGVFNLMMAPDVGMWRGRSLPGSKTTKGRRPTAPTPQSAAPEPETRARLGQDAQPAPRSSSEPMCGLDLLLAQHKH